MIKEPISFSDIRSYLRIMKELLENSWNDLSLLPCIDMNQWWYQRNITCHTHFLRAKSTRSGEKLENQKKNPLESKSIAYLLHSEKRSLTTFVLAANLLAYFSIPISFLPNTNFPAIFSKNVCSLRDSHPIL